MLQVAVLYINNINVHVLVMFVLAFDILKVKLLRKQSIKSFPYRTDQFYLVLL